MHSDTTEKTLETSPLVTLANGISDFLDQTANNIAAALRQWTTADKEGDILQSLPWRKFKHFWKSEGVLDRRPDRRKFSWSEYNEYRRGMRAHCRSLARYGMPKSCSLFLALMLETRMQSMLATPFDVTHHLSRRAWPLQQLEKQLQELVLARKTLTLGTAGFTAATTALRMDFEAATPVRVIATACARVWRADLSAAEYAEYMEREAGLMELQCRSILAAVKQQPKIFSVVFIERMAGQYREKKRALRQFRKQIPELVRILADLRG